MEKTVRHMKKIMLNLIEKKGTVVQLVRAPPCHGGSCGFESRQSRIKIFNFA